MCDFLLFHLVVVEKLVCIKNPKCVVVQSILGIMVGSPLVICLRERYKLVIRKQQSEEECEVWKLRVTNCQSGSLRQENSLAPSPMTGKPFSGSMLPTPVGNWTRKGALKIVCLTNFLGILPPSVGSYLF